MSSPAEPGPGRPAREGRAVPLHRMSGEDAGYLYMETPSMHMHTLKIALLENPSHEFDLAYFNAELLRRMHRMPPLQRRIAPVPGLLHHPIWLQERDIDPTRHVVHHRLPDGAGIAELEDLIGRVASTPLDRSRPLWEIHVAEGLADGRIAIIGKLHHAVADGGAANALLSNLTGLDLGPETGPGSPSVAPPRPLPTRGQLLRQGLWDAVKQAFTLPGLVWRTARNVAAVVKHKRSSDVATPVPVLDAPRASFNGALTPRRAFATVSLPLAEVKAAKDRHGVTLNDVLLGLVSGALRRWMADRGEHHDRSLLAGVPVSVDEPGGEPRLVGNRVSNLFTTLATDVDDVSERLRTISRVTHEAKVVQQKLGPTMLAEWVQFTPPHAFSALMRLYSRKRAASKHPPPFNVVVSNVRGPGSRLEIPGAPVSDLYSVGPILEGIGLNVTAWSYIDRLNISLICCPDLLADLRGLVAAFRPALDELLGTPEQTPPGKESP